MRSRLSDRVDGYSLGGRAGVEIGADRVRQWMDAMFMGERGAMRR